MPIKHLQTGFGLIELMVSISIMLLVMSVIITRQDSFNGATLLRGEAYEVALLVREIQALAVSAAFTSGAGPDAYRSVIGVHFRSTVVADGSYPVFKDDNGDNFYSDSEIYGKQGLLDPRFQISEIRLIEDGQPPVVVGANGLSVVFERPNFDAKLYEGPNNAVDPNISGVEIDVRVRGTGNATGPGDVRTVEITKTGQISVKSL